MGQLDTLRERFDPNGKWFRVGVVSATAVAPLIARWNDLRNDKRAVELREQAVELREQAEARLGDVRDRLRTGASDALRQARPLAERLPFVPVAPVQPKRRANTGLWLAGVAVGLVAAGVTVYVVTRRRMATPEDEEAMVELPLDIANGASDLWPSTAQSPENAESEMSVEALDETVDASGNVDEVEDEVEDAEDTDAARFVGNIHTMIYHDADDEEHLPAEENRIYFATAEEADEAGFRRSRSPMEFGDKASVTEAEGPGA